MFRMVRLVNKQDSILQNEPLFPHEVISQSLLKHEITCTVKNISIPNENHIKRISSLNKRQNR